MKRGFLAALAIVLCGMAQEARANCSMCCPPCVTWVPCSFTCYRAEMRTRDVPFTVNTLVPRQEIIQRKCIVMTPQWRDEQRTCMVTVMQPRTLTSSNPVTTMVPTIVQDPCTGCCYTVCKPVTTLQQCTKTFMAPVQVPQQFTVKVCQMVPVERTIEERRTVCDTVAVPMVRKECYMVMVPYQATALMAVMH
jgi:hypothetical protein